MQRSNRQSVAGFFDSISDEYTTAIDRIFPRYREMLSTVIEYLPVDREYNSILELGCGTGNYSILLRHAFPKAMLHCVDVSGDSLDQCSSRIGKNSHTIFEQADFRELDYGAETFDLVTSSIAIHHLNSNEKQEFFQRMHTWLSSTGVFTFADQFAGVTSELYERHLTGWQKVAFDAGSTQDEWDMWMQHQCEHDFHDSIVDQMRWLNDAGFQNVDCVWRYLLWTVLQCTK